MPAGPASLHHTGSLPASLPSCSSSQLPVQVEGEKAPCPSWGSAPGHGEVECSNFSICAARASTGMLQGMATQWRSHLLKVKAPQAQSFPSREERERGCPPGPCPRGSGVFQATVIPVSLLLASQHTPSPGHWEETEAFSSSAERQAKDAGKREREPHKLGISAVTSAFRVLIFPTDYVLSTDCMLDLVPGTGGGAGSGTDRTEGCALRWERQTRSGILCCAALPVSSTHEELRFSEANRLAKGHRMKVEDPGLKAIYPPTHHPVIHLSTHPFT